MVVQKVSHHQMIKNRTNKACQWDEIYSSNSSNESSII